VPSVTVTTKDSAVTADWKPPASGSVTSYAVILERRRSDGTWGEAATATVAADDRTWKTTAPAAGTYRVVVVATGPGGNSDPAASDPFTIS
jgi:hypothetical protein